jgi:hypothetical protein
MSLFASFEYEIITKMNDLSTPKRLNTHNAWQSIVVIGFAAHPTGWFHGLPY